MKENTEVLSYEGPSHIKEQGKNHNFVIPRIMYLNITCLLVTSEGCGRLGASYKICKITFKIHESHEQTERLVVIT